MIVQVWKTKLFKKSGMIFFEERINVYFNEATGGRYVPRAVLMDLEPGGGFADCVMSTVQNLSTPLQHDVEEHNHVSVAVTNPSHFASKKLP